MTANLEPGNGPAAEPASRLNQAVARAGTVAKSKAGPYARRGVFLLAVVAVLGWGCNRRQGSSGGPGGGRPGLGSFAVPVIAGTVESKDVPIYLDGIGNVQAFNLVTVRSRVDGQIEKIAFVEGQDVRAGDLLAQIDPAPFQAQLDQCVAKKAQDEAQSAVARLTLGRDKELLASKILAQQDYDTQEALVEQLVATVKADQAAISNAQVQLSYATITSPLAGRAGLRLVDQGNLVHASDASGIVVITQLRPIAVVFMLPETTLGQIQARVAAGQTLSAFAMGRDNRTRLAEGKLAVIDNQIDATTGTIRLKAIFPNDDLKLWPGQFVNARLLLETRKGGTVVPAAVVQHGPAGDFAYVIDNDLKAQVRPIKVAQTQEGQALIQEGLQPGERVVVDGQYRLQGGAKVELRETAAPAGKSEGPRLNAAEPQPGAKRQVLGGKSNVGLPPPR
ncbi:MAG: efflux RND transporter periplasmic adaptor subunit [Verrucomicrobiota bacterium]|jgi:multidrug efflux system membrane fusion protein